MAIQVLELHDWRPTLLNVLLRANKHRRSEMLHLDAQIIAAEVFRQGLTKAHQKRSVSLIIRHKRSGPAPDPDSLHKSTLDALKKCGMLRDDCHHWLELGPVSYEVAKKPGLIVVLEDLEE